MGLELRQFMLVAVAGLSVVAVSAFELKGMAVQFAGLRRQVDPPLEKRSKLSQDRAELDSRSHS